MELPLPMKSTPILLVLTLVGAAAGYWLGHTRATAAADAHTRQLVLQASQAATAAAKAEATRAFAAKTSIPMPAGMDANGLAGIMSAPGPLDRFQGIFSHIQGLPGDQIESEILSVRDQLQAGNFDPERLFAMHLLMTRFGIEQPDRAITWLNGQDMLTRGFGTVTVLASLASKDPQQAAKFFNDPDNPVLKMPRVGSFAALGVAREWARTDPAGAMAWAKSLPEDSRAGAYTGLIGGQMSEDPLAATRTAKELPPGEDRERLMGHIAENWGTKDPTEALKWANTLEGPEKIESTKKALNGWANKDPKAAADHLQTLPATDRDQYTGSIAGRWANRNPAEAAAWVATQPEGDGRKDAVGSVMNTWSETEPEKASAWLVTQPAGPSKDQGIVSLANSQVRSDPEAALTWASSISDPTTRSLQLKGNVRQWARRDAPAATQWVTTAPGLSPEERTELLPKPK
jgi:hypothetical protein